MKKTVTYMVEGGLGKHIMFSAMIPDLYKKNNNQKINICSAYPDVFAWNKYVQKSFSHQQQEENKEIISDLIYREPYKSMFNVEKTKHLLYYWAKDLDIEFNKDWKPMQIDIKDENLKDKVDKLVSDLGDFIVVQFMGGQPPVGFDPKSAYQNNPMQMQRNYQFPFAQTLINKIKAKYPNLKIIDYSLPNEHQGYQGAMRVELPYIAYAELVKHSKCVIGIDSSLLHFASAGNVKAIGLWGGCPEWQFGWKNITNITNFKGKKENFNPYDPYYISIDSDVILKELDKKLL